eukprot:361912-Chlamydomonas_euryale.AAC.1
MQSPSEPPSMSMCRGRKRKWAKQMCGTRPFFAYCSACGWPICLETDEMRPELKCFGHPSPYSSTHHPQRKTPRI